MSVHNVIDAPVRCPHCHLVSHSEIEGFVGFGNLKRYAIGDRIDWMPRKSVQHGGRPPDGDIDAEGYTVCEHCGRDFFVRLRVRGDVLIEVEANPDKKGYMA